MGTESDSEKTSDLRTLRRQAGCVNESQSRNLDRSTSSPTTYQDTGRSHTNNATPRCYRAVTAHLMLCAVGRLADDQHRAALVCQ